MRSMTEPDTMVVAVAAKVYWKNQMWNWSRGIGCTAEGGEGEE